jgi:uncharacterized protein
MLSRQQIVVGCMVVAAIAATVFWRVEQRNPPVEASSPAQQTERTRTVSVSGYGTVEARPDMATIDLAVKTTDESVVKAVDDNSTTIALVIDAVRKVGVDSSDIETNFFWVAQDFKTKGNTAQDAPIPVYGVTNSITVTVRDLDKVSAVISAAVDAGANQVSSPRFFVSDTTPYVDQARDLALADARARAETLAAAYGMTVGDPIYLSDTAYRSGGGGGGGGGGPVIIPGTESVSFSVGVTFDLQ